MNELSVSTVELLYVHFPEAQSEEIGGHVYYITARKQICLYSLSWPDPRVKMNKEKQMNAVLMSLIVSEM